MKYRMHLAGTFAFLFCLIVGTSHLAQASEMTSVCEAVKIDMDRETATKFLEEAEASYETESLEHLYDQNGTSKDELNIPEFLQASYPRELIYGTAKNSNGAEIAFIVGISANERVGAVSCTRVYSP